MMDGFVGETIQRPEGNIFYLAGGPADGPPLVFVHGWPAAPETWRDQLISFASLGFRVIATANRGHSRSAAPKETSEYTVEKLVGDLRAVLEHINHTKAIWVGHDWGCGPVWALAAHYPDLCAGVINLCVPYRTLERGIERGLLPYVNRSVYPVNEYPYGPWDYQHFYETSFSKAVAEFDMDISKTVKALYIRGGRAPLGTPSPTATVSKRGGWFGGQGAPDSPLEKTVLDEELHKIVTAHLQETGFFGTCAWYMNHAANQVYSDKSVNGGMLDMPVLFIEAKGDIVCDTAISTLAEPMRTHCSNLTQCSIDAGHWVALEKPHETNAAIARWIVKTLPTYWPGFWRTPFVQHSKSRY